MAVLSTSGVLFDSETKMSRGIEASAVLLGPNQLRRYRKGSIEHQALLTKVL